MKYSLGCPTSGSQGPPEGDKPIQILANMYQKISLRHFVQQHHFAGVKKNTGMRTPEISLGLFFLPCLTEFNSKRQQLLKTTMLLLDESMSGWRPKTTQLGGIPNITYEPRKPKPLGTMFRNGVECISGVLVAQDVVQLPEQ